MQLPQYTFTANTTSTGIFLSVSILNGIRPTTVRLWRGNNPVNRDFRYPIIGAAFWSTIIQESSTKPFTWQVFAPNPSKGYQALMMELEFDNFVTSLPPVKITTSSYIIPDTYICAKGSSISIEIFLFLASVIFHFL